MKVAAVVALVAFTLAFPAPLLALATESFGSAPAVKQPGWAEGVLDVVNLKSRVYSNWVNGNENFYYRGDASDLNQALKKFAAVKSGSRQVNLLPGQGQTQAFNGKQVAFDWQLHVPSGIYSAMTGKKHAVLTVYVSAAKPRGKIDRKQAERWIAELDDESFETRQKAEQGLRDLGRDAKPLLREALKARPPLEARRRIERLLKGLPGIDAADLEVPKGVTLITVDDLLTSHFKDLENTNENACALAIHGLSGLCCFSDKVVPALIGMLKKDKKEYVRRVAASCLAHLGAEARAAVQALKEGLGDADANVRAAFQDAISRIEKAKEEPGKDDEVKRKRSILKDITELKKAFSK